MITAYCVERIFIKGPSWASYTAGFQTFEDLWVQGHHPMELEEIVSDL